jgi:hypothetical protein
MARTALHELSRYQQAKAPQATCNEVGSIRAKSRRLTGLLDRLERWRKRLPATNRELIAASDQRPQLLQSSPRFCASLDVQVADVQLRQLERGRTRERSHGQLRGINGFTLSYGHAAGSGHHEADLPLHAR